MACRYTFNHIKAHTNANIKGICACLTYSMPYYNLMLKSYGCIYMTAVTFSEKLKQERQHVDSAVGELSEAVRKVNYQMNQIKEVRLFSDLLVMSGNIGPGESLEIR